MVAMETYRLIMVKTEIAIINMVQWGYLKTRFQKVRLYSSIIPLICYSVLIWFSFNILTITRRNVNQVLYTHLQVLSVIFRKFVKALRPLVDARICWAQYLHAVIIK